MPTYEYRCTSCHFEFEEFQSMASEPITRCPHCGYNTVQRKISGGAGLIFKGNGFYITDYKKKDTVKETKPKSQKEKKPKAS